MSLAAALPISMSPAGTPAKAAPLRAGPQARSLSVAVAINLGNAYRKNRHARERHPPVALRAGPQSGIGKGTPELGAGLYIAPAISPEPKTACESCWN